MKRVSFTVLIILAGCKAHGSPVTQADISANEYAYQLQEEHLTIESDRCLLNSLIVGMRREDSTWQKAETRIQNAAKLQLDNWKQIAGEPLRVMNVEQLKAKWPKLYNDAKTDADSPPLPEDLSQLVPWTPPFSGAESPPTP